MGAAPKPSLMSLAPPRMGWGTPPSSSSFLPAPCPCPVSSGSPAPVPDPPEPGCHHVRVRLPPAPACGRALLQALRTLQCPLCSVGTGTGPCTPPGEGSPHYQPWAEARGARPPPDRGPGPDCSVPNPCPALPGGWAGAPSPRTGWGLSWHPQIPVPAPQFRQEEGTEVVAVSGAGLS